MTHFLLAQVQELIELDAPVGEGTERPLLLEISSQLRVGHTGISLNSERASSVYSIPTRVGDDYTDHLESGFSSVARDLGSGV